MSDGESFLNRPEVKSALDDLVAQRLKLTADGRGDEELPDAIDYLRAQGIALPTGTGIRLLRTMQESDVKPLGPMCNGERARPVNCQWIGKHYVCEWVCP